MEKKSIYIATYYGSAYDNGEREVYAQPYFSIGDAIIDAISEIKRQQRDNPNFVEARLLRYGNNGITVVPEYQDTKWNGKTWENGAPEGSWASVRIEMMNIK